MFRQKIISFEGVDGSGKTTHQKKILKYLKSKKINVLSFREPGGSKNAEKLRKIILKNKNKFDKFTDLLLYMASRNENMKMIEIYKKAKVIIIDRFIHSSLAYQHYGMKVNLDVINKLNDFILNNKKIHFTFLMLVSKKNLKKRLKLRKRLNRYDRFKLSFYNKVQNGYLKLSKREKNKFLIINSDNDLKYNEKIIMKKINSILKIK